MSQLNPDTSPTHARVRVLFLIDASASMAEGHRLEAIDRFLADMRSRLAGSARANLGERIEIQAIRFADGAEWHVRQPTLITALDWPPVPPGGGPSLGAALTLAATVFTDSSAPDTLHIVVLITDGLPTDDFATGVADFNAAVSDKKFVRVAVAIDGCDIEVLKRFVGGPEPIYVASDGAGLKDALNDLLEEQLFPRAISAASDEENGAYDEIADDVAFSAAAQDSPEAANYFEFAVADFEDEWTDDLALACPADDEDQDDANTSPTPASRQLDDVQFTVYRPKMVRPREWKPLLVFMHLADRRPDAPDYEPDPIEQVRQQAQTLLGAAAADYRDISADARHGIPKESEITLVPDVPGVSFNPPSRRFRWEKDVHREEFDLRADPSLDGKVARGSISAYLGVILIARIDLAISVNSSHRDTDDAQNAETIHTTPYRKIFASYSRRDAEIVRQFEQFIETTGDRFLQDVRHLRAGEKWDDGLLRLIDQADVFQLFWSSNSMGSPHVRREWEYALSLGRPAFIRPTFWEDPFPESPKDSLPPESLRRLHFHRLATVPAKPSASDRPIAGHARAPTNPSHISPSLRPSMETGRPLPLPAAGAAPSMHHKYHRIDKPFHKTRRQASVFVLLALVAAGVVLATVLLWMLSRVLS